MCLMETRLLGIFPQIVLLSSVSASFLGNIAGCFTRFKLEDIIEKFGYLLC